MSQSNPRPLDAFDMSNAVHGGADSPDVRNWPVQKTISRVHLAQSEVYQRGNLLIDFDGRDTLPEARPVGWNSGISYTVWGGFNRNGAWVVAPLVECIGKYVPTGNLFAPRQIGDNLLYYAELDSRIRYYNPQPSEAIALFVTSGDTRRMNVQAGAPWRSNVVVVLFQPGAYTFAAPEEPAAPTPEAPVPVAAPDAVVQRLANIEKQLEALSRRRYTGRIVVPGWPSWLGGPIDVPVTLVPSDPE